jgi:integrase/recombinase XerD
MKIDRHDQAKILSPDEIKSLFESGLKTARDRALFGVCLYTGARIAEACSLHTKDVYSIDGSIRPRVTIRRGNTKGKSSTRSIPVGGELRVLLSKLLLAEGLPVPRSSWSRAHSSGFSG